MSHSGGSNGIGRDSSAAQAEIREQQARDGVPDVVVEAPVIKEELLKGAVVQEEQAATQAGSGVDLRKHVDSSRIPLQALPDNDLLAVAKAKGVSTSPFNRTAVILALTNKGVDSVSVDEKFAPPAPPMPPRNTAV